MNAEDAGKSGDEEGASVQKVVTASPTSDQTGKVQQHAGEDDSSRFFKEKASTTDEPLSQTEPSDLKTNTKNINAQFASLDVLPPEPEGRHISVEQPNEDDNEPPAGKPSLGHSNHPDDQHHASGVQAQTTQDASRTSLEILQALTGLDYGTTLSQAADTPLPASGASSISSVPIRTSTSHALPLGQSRERLELRPEQVPLPARKAKRKKNAFLTWAGGTTNSGAKKKDAPKQGQQKNTPPADTELKNYRKNINRLAEHFPNFQNIATKDTRHQWSSRIIIHDRVSGPEPQASVRQEPFEGRSTAPAFDEFQKRLRNITDDCLQRLILVEDLSPNLIDLLGATFDIAPHVFEEHLDRSGYKKAPEDEATSGPWHTQFSSLGHSSVASVMWYRPVLPLIPMSQRFRAKLVRGRRPQVYCPFDGCPRHSLPLGATANIWRHSLELCPEPGVYHKGSRTEYPVGWEEKVTIWKRDIDGCEFVIALVDPLPVVVVSEERLASTREVREQRLFAMGNRWIRKEEGVIIEHHTRSSGGPRKRQHVTDWLDTSALPLSNSEGHAAPLFPMPLPPFTNSRLSTDNGLPGPIPILLTANRSKVPPNTTRSTAEPAFTPAALRRRATRTETEFSESERPRSKKGTKAVPVTNPIPPPPPLPGVLPQVPPPPLPPPGGAFSYDEESLSIETHGPFVPYHPIKARSSTAAYNDATFVTKHMRAYIESLQIPKSTLDELDHYLCQPVKGKNTTWEPLRALFRAIHDDTHSLVDVARTSLQRIREGTLDEDLMQKRVTFWRGLLHRLSYNFGELDQNLRAFVQFVHESEARSRELENMSEKLAKETRHTLQDCIMLIDRTSHALLAEMQIVDSRRSIAEAESVSKLTELAFVFIPLSFVASLFSMQVHELDGGVPAYRFALVAIGFVLMAYAVRLSIRSSHLIDYKNRMFIQIRNDSKLQYNESIPSHTFMRWVGLNFGGALFKSAKNFISVFAPVILLLAVVAAILSPIVVLWTRNIDKGFTAIITVLLLLLDGVLVLPIVTSASGKFDFNPRERIRKIRQRHQVKSKKRRLRKAGLDSETTEESDSGDDGYDVGQ